MTHAPQPVEEPPTGPALAIAGGGVNHVLELARRHLDMDVALLSEFVGGHQVHRRATGDAGSFGFALGAGTPLTQTYCQAMVLEQIPNAIGDTNGHPVLRGLSATAAATIGAYVGVPVRLADGTLYGSLCVLSHQAQQVDERDAKFLAMLAELVAREVEADLDQQGTRERMVALITGGDIIVALQPIVDVTTGRTVGVEALTRFPSEYGPPDVVFAAAHAAGVGLELEQMALQHAFELMPLLGPHAYLAVNLSAQGAIALVPAWAERQNFPYDRIVLEITEHAVIESYARLRDSLAPARRRGLRLSIDDAGAGYASLHHIVQLVPDIIKIDRSLIDGISTRPALRSVATAFVALARDLGAVVVAEGVEHHADLRMVQQLGINVAQGYLLGRPSADRTDLDRWLTTGPAPSSHLRAVLGPRNRAKPPSVKDELPRPMT